MKIKVWATSPVLLDTLQALSQDFQKGGLWDPSATRDGCGKGAPPSLAKHGRSENVPFLEGYE